jgi:hypothetical protein
MLGKDMLTCSQGVQYNFKVNLINVKLLEGQYILKVKGWSFFIKKITKKF